MLDVFIIEEIRQRREERADRDERPVLQIPVPVEPDAAEYDEDEVEEPRVIIIDL